MNNTLEKLIKEKNYCFNSLTFNLAKEYSLSLEEFILLIYFLNQDIPTFDVEKIKSITKLEINKILDSFTSLNTKGLISIKVVNQNNIVNEIVDLDSIYKNMVSLINNTAKKEVNISIFDTFEKEFSRTLSPMEYEIINDWLNNNISEEIILGALKEATYNGVSSLRYIDKIIHEWTKKGFKTMQDVNNHLKNRSTEVKEIKEYDWLNE